jgi:hypothetical protein
MVVAMNRQLWILMLIFMGTMVHAQAAGPYFPPQNANTVLAGPTTGAAASPAFRALVAADTGGGTSGTLPPAGAVGELQYINCVGSGNTQTVTMTIASPAVVTWATSVQWSVSATNPTVWTCPIVFTTTGALPTGITSGTTYYIVGASVSGLNFDLATTAANALACTASFPSCTGIVNTSGSQSGTQTGTMGAALTTATWTAGAGMLLSAGDWDCTSLWQAVAASLTTDTGYLSGTSTSIAQPGNNNYSSVRYASGSIGSPAQNLISPPVLALYSSPTIIYGEGQVIFGGGTATGSAFLRCRRWP